MCKMHMFYWLRRAFCVCLAVGLLTVCFAGCSSSGDQPEGTLDPGEYAPSSGMNLSEEAATELNNKVRIITYFVSEDGKQLEGEIRYMELEEAKQSTENIATAIVTELLKGPSADFSGKKVIPDGTKILEGVKISGNLATVNLSAEFVENCADDKTMMEMSIYSLVNSVTEIKELEKVKILIDGEEVASMKGVVEMSKPFKRNKSLISMNQLAAKDTIADISDYEEEYADVPLE